MRQTAARPTKPELPTLEEIGGFYYAADQATETESLRYLAVAVADFTGSPLPIRFDDWRQAIDTLLAETADREVPVVIDEFPYLATASPSLPSIIQSALAPRRAGRLQSRAGLLLCGSAMSFMARCWPVERRCAGARDWN